MGGGEDSRIPAILNENIGTRLPDDIRIRVIVRIYSIDPDVAWRQISEWYSELKPQMVIGESLGANHAIRLSGVPHILISPAIGAARWMSLASRIPGSSAIMRMIFKTREGNRQELDFSRMILKNYRGLRHKVTACSPAEGGKDSFYAFFGTKDTYRRSGVVSIRSWRRHFGKNSCRLYEGTHYMEEEHLHSMLVPKILEMLGITCA